MKAGNYKYIFILKKYRVILLFALQTLYSSGFEVFGAAGFDRRLRINAASQQTTKQMRSYLTFCEYSKFEVE